MHLFLKHLERINSQQSVSVEVLQKVRPAIWPVGDAVHGGGKLPADALGVLAQHVQGGLGGQDAVEVAGDKGQAVLLGVGGRLDLNFCMINLVVEFTLIRFMLAEQENCR